MKKFLTKRFLGMSIIIPIVLLLLMTAGGVAYAAFIPENLEGSGTITVQSDEAYHLSGLVMAFQSQTITPDTPFSITTTLTITNDGTNTINGVTLAPIHFPTGMMGGSLTAVLTDTTLLTGESTTITFALSGTTGGVGTIDLTTLTCTLIPITTP